MKWYHRKRLNKLADFLDKLPSTQFNISTWVSRQDDEHKCGTVCCAIGWCPKVFPKQWKWSWYFYPYPSPRADGEFPNRSAFDTASDFFGISNADSRSIFTSSAYNTINDNVTPKMVAEKLREIAKK